MKPAFALAFCCAMTACETSTTLIAEDVFQASLNGDKVRPTAVTTTGVGTLTITLRSNTSVLEYDLEYSGLATAAVSAHIHGPGDTSAVLSQPLIDFASPPASGQGSLQLGTTGSAKGSFDLHQAINPLVKGDSLFKLLHAGLLYVDVHTSGNSAGEIRGQINKR